jgi:hypothetical protein
MMLIQKSSQVVSQQMDGRSLMILPALTLPW